MVKRTFKILWANLQWFLPIMIVASVMGVLLGLWQGTTRSVVMIFMTLIFVILWLMTIYIARFKVAKKKLKLVDFAKNALKPILSVIVVLIVAIVQVVPVLFLIIVYATALETHFLATFGYLVLFLIFAGMMIWLTGYLLPPTIISMVAVTAPGLYPIEAMRLAGNVMRGNRLKFWLEILKAVAVLGAIWAVVIVPLILLAAPFTVVTVTVLMGFSVIFMATYLYLYYKDMIK